VRVGQVRARRHEHNVGEGDEAAAETDCRPFTAAMIGSRHATMPVTICRRA